MPLIEADTVHMIQIATLRRANVVEDSSRGGRSSRLTREAEAFEREDTKMIFQQRNGVVGREDPILKRSFGVGGTEAIVYALAIKQRS